MRKIISLYIYLLFVNCFGATISGRVTDASTGLPAAYVSVFADNGAIITACNAKGEFVISDENASKTLIFSHIGYQTDTVKAEASYFLDIKLIPAVNMLPEVNFTYNYAQDLVEKATEKLFKGKNSVYYMNAYYKNFNQVNGCPTEFQEIVFQTHGNAYQLWGGRALEGRYFYSKGLTSKFNPDLSNNALFGNFLVHYNSDKKPITTFDTSFTASITGFIKYEKSIVAIVVNKHRKSNYERILFIDTLNHRLYKHKEIDFGNPNFPFFVRNAYIHKTREIQFDWQNDTTAYIRDIVCDNTLKCTFFFKNYVVKMNPYAVFYNYTKVCPEGFKPIDQYNRWSDRRKIDSTAVKPDFWKNFKLVKYTTKEDSLIKVLLSKRTAGRYSE